ncbi:MAG: anti-sigma factor family protein [Candidatus Aminicenantia bacterium]
MKCLDIEQIYHYLEGEVSSSQAERIEHHLSFCMKCSQLVRERKILLGGIKEIPKFTPPSDFVEKVMFELFPSKITLLKLIITFFAGSLTFSLILLGFLRLTGQSVSSLLINLNHSLWQTIKNGAIIFIKIFKLFSIAIGIIQHILAYLLKMIKSFTSVVGTEVQVAAIMGFIVLTILFVSFLTYFPIKKFFTGR